MFRLALLLCAAGYIYSLGQHSATPDAAKSNGIGAVATAVARQVHERTAWAAGPDEAQPQAEPVLEAQAQPVAEPIPAAPPAPRGLRVVFEPEFDLAAR
jgi:hypothetical protein